MRRWPVSSGAAERTDHPRCLHDRTTKKKVWSLLLRPVAVGYAYGVAQIPAERLAILRKAFDDMLKDAEMRAEAAKMNLPIEGMSGADVDKIAAEMFNADAKTIETVKSLIPN
jgi:hypothetical protein